MNALITAFEPFGGEKINPTILVLDALSESIISPFCQINIKKLVLPTIFGESSVKLNIYIDKLINELKDSGESLDFVICLGQAAERSSVSIERVAINIDDARIPDNEGNSPIDQKICEDGSNAYFSSLPIKAIVKEIKNAGLKAEVSNSAGTYVCNHIMYNLLYILENKYKNSGIRGGFIHIPLIPEQIKLDSKLPSMSLSEIVHAVEIAIVTTSKLRDDIHYSDGKIC